MIRLVIAIFVFFILLSCEDSNVSFSDRVRPIGIGDTQDQVKLVLGKPLRTVKNDPPIVKEFFNDSGESVGKHEEDLTLSFGPYFEEDGPTPPPYVIECGFHQNRLIELRTTSFEQPGKSAR